ncbi:MAG: CPBP family intramembrane glutamic endopeptidase [Mycobacteriales bacterium]
MPTAPEPRPDAVSPAPVPGRRTVAVEIWIVLAVSLGMSGLFALVNLVDDLTKPIPLAQQSTQLNQSQSTRHLFDLLYQLLGIASSAAPAALALYLLVRSGRRLSHVGVDRREPRRDLGRGCLLAAIIGIPGLGLYLAAHALGINVSVQGSGLPDVWWRYPVLVLSAIQNAVLEEIVVVAYLLTRLRDLRWRTETALATSAVLRGSYHLYQGFGGFIGNAVMGVIFGFFFTRTRRVLPLVIAHALIDTVSFVGYAALHGHVSWLSLAILR